MVDRTRRVEHIPRAWGDQVQRQVKAGRAFQDAVREVLAANAKLLVLPGGNTGLRGTASGDR